MHRPERASLLIPVRRGTHRPALLEGFRRSGAAPYWAAVENPGRKSGTVDCPGFDPITVVPITPIVAPNGIGDSHGTVTDFCKTRHTISGGTHPQKRWPQPDKLNPPSPIAARAAKYQVASTCVNKPRDPRTPNGACRRTVDFDPEARLD
jgi:hypothetical protein